MNSVIRESVDKAYHKFNQIKRNGYDRIKKFFHCNKNYSSDTESDENVSLEYEYEYDNDSYEYYSDISEDENI